MLERTICYAQSLERYSDFRKQFTLQTHTLFVGPYPEQAEHLLGQVGSWMIQKFWASSMAFVKIWIVVFIKRLFGAIRAYAVISYCLAGFIATWALAALLVNIFQCTPVQYYYDKTWKDTA
ncbi:hypothetical protein VN97_g11519 [Penicillium thymicola]|uniref:Rhodopsin domain-containing protein n=1 Tax=Penicillium thymicola TaxID=293382 RepID=A0AAI9T6Y5_PENTH|nr:hypothetical protein VN97_g11519 [Penicillium thymicola]